MVDDRIGIEDVEKKICERGIFDILTVGDIRLLYRVASDLPEGSKILEIGTGHGRSTQVMSMAAPSSALTTVDVVNCWDGSQEKNVIRIIGDSSKVVGEMSEKFDLIFIDGDHTKEAVLKDIAVCFPRLKNGSLLVFHDYFGSHPGVAVAVDAFMSASKICKRESIKSGEETTVCYLVRKC